jgi:predicted PurR-regulated permease PerM
MDLSRASEREHVTWGIVGLLILVAVVFVLRSLFGALVVGLFLYYAVRPVDRWLDERLEHPDVSATVALSVVGLPMMLVIAYATLIGAQELDQFLGVTDLGALRQSLGPYVDVVTAAGDGGLLGLARDNLGRISGVTSAAFVWVLRLFVILTVAFYLLRDDMKIARWFRRTFEDHPTAIAFTEGVDSDLTTIYTGNLITIGVTALLAAAVFYGLDAVAPSGTAVDYPILLGLVVGVATVIPAVGMKLVYFPYTAYLLWLGVTTDAPLWFPVVFFIVTLVAVDAFPDFFIRSYLSKGDLNMGLLLLTYVLGAVAFGWYGVFFGPVVLVLALNFGREIFPELV